MSWIGVLVLGSLSRIFVSFVGNTRRHCEAHRCFFSPLGVRPWAYSFLVQYEAAVRMRVFWVHFSFCVTCFSVGKLGDQLLDPGFL